MLLRWLLSDWWRVLTVLVFLFCSCIGTTNISKKPGPVLPESTTQQSEGGSSSAELDDAQLKKFQESAHNSRIAPRKGVVNPPDMDDINQSSESCDSLTGKDQSSVKCTTSSPVPKNDSSTLEHGIPVSKKNESVVETSANSSVSAGLKPAQITIPSVKKQLSNVNLSSALSTSKPVLKPIYTSDDFANSADYDQTDNPYTSKSSWFLTTFSLSIFIVFLAILIFALFYKLKHKFSVQQNYRRVDYLIDGMYID